MRSLTELSYGLNGTIHRSAMPFGKYDPEGALIKHYQQAEIDTVVVLAEQAEILAQTGRDLPGIYREIGLNIVHLPIMDFGVPDQEELRKVLDGIAQQAQAGKNVVIHCSAGIGRTGLFSACLAKKILNLDGWEAVDWTRQQIPGAIETQEQVEFILAYAA